MNLNQAGQKLKDEINVTTYLAATKNMVPFRNKPKIRNEHELHETTLICFEKKIKGYDGDDDDEKSSGETEGLDLNETKQRKMNRKLKKKKRQHVSLEFYPEQVIYKRSGPLTESYYYIKVIYNK